MQQSVRVPMVDVLTWSSRVRSIAISMRVLVASLSTITGSGSVYTTRRAGVPSAYFNWLANPGVQNVCAQTSIRQLLMSITSSRTAGIPSSFTRESSDHYVIPTTQGKLCRKSGGGVAKMFSLGRRIARWASHEKKIPNVRISGSITYA